MSGMSPEERVERFLPIFSAGPLTVVGSRH